MAQQNPIHVLILAHLPGLCGFNGALRWRHLSENAARVLIFVIANRDSTASGVVPSPAPPGL